MANSPTFEMNYNFFDEWIDGTAVQRLCDDEASSGFAWNLYQQILDLLAELIQTQSSSKEDLPSMRQSLGNLFLWGDGLRNGKLDIILDESDDLRGSIISLLAAVGDLLISRKVICDSWYFTVLTSS